MSDKNPAPRPLSLRSLLIWAIPFALGLAALALVMWAGWELWTGIGFVIAGALGSLMMVGQHYRIGPDS
jgi:fatty acid desaturase